ncbi:MAG: FAD-dependent oxidoreductase [Bacteroidota bacterium]
MSISYWEKTTFLADVDYLIIGGGIVGLNAALELRDLAPKAKILLLERASIPQGASTKNAGFACLGSPSELLEDLRHSPHDQVWETVEARWKGLQRLREKVGDQNLMYRDYGGFELFKRDRPWVFEDCLKQLSNFNHNFKHITGEADAFYVADDAIKRFQFKQVEHLIACRLEGQLHPGKMVQALQDLMRDADIQQLYGMAVDNWVTTEDGVIVHTQNGYQLRTKRLLIATNGFAQRFFSEQDITAVRNQVLVTAPIEDLPFKACFHYDEGYYYFRNVGDRVLIGGGRNLDAETETTDQFGQTEIIKNALMEMLQNVILPHRDFSIEHCWSGILGVGKSKRPIIQMMNERVGVAVRLGGMGVAIGTNVGEEAARMLAK